MVFLEKPNLDEGIPTNYNKKIITKLFLNLSDFIGLNNICYFKETTLECI